MLTYYDKAKEIIDSKIVVEEFFETLKEKKEKNIESSDSSSWSCIEKKDRLSIQ